MNEEMVTLGAVAENSVEKSGPTGETFIYVDISSIDRDRKVISEPKALPTSSAPSRAKQVLHTGDVLVSMTRPNLNQVAMVTPEFHGAIGSTGFHVLRSQWAEPKFLFYLVQSNDFIDEMCKCVQGALYPAVRPRDISSFEFFLPSSLEQQRIVAAIDTHFSRLDEAVTNLKRVKANLKRYKAAVLKAAVEGKLTEEWRKQHPDVEPADKLLERILAERRKATGKGKYKEPVGPDTNGLPELPAGWVWARLGSLPVDVFDGPFGSNLKSSDYVSSGVRVIRLENIGSREFFDDKESFVTEQKYDQLKKHTVRHGDIIFSSFVANETRVVMLPVHIEKAINKADCFCVRVNANTIDKRYIETFLATRTAYEQLVGGIHGATRPRINTTQLKDCHVPIPPVAEQVEIVSKLSAMLSVAEVTDAQVDANLRRADRLRQSILKQAFSGQLVPQDPNDEPAGVLLERIRNAHVGAPLAAPRPSPLPAPRPQSEHPERAQQAAPLRKSEGKGSSLDAVIAAILTHMQPGREYARADLADPLGLTTGQWNAAIHELKRQGKVSQVGERRGARYAMV